MERDIDLLWEELALDPDFIDTKSQNYKKLIEIIENDWLESLGCNPQPQPKKEPLWKTYHREGLKRLNEQQQKWDNLNKK